MSRSFDHFDFVARYYDRLAGRAEHDPLPGIVDARPGDLVLDVGGGTGRNAPALTAGGARVIIADRSPGMLLQARAKGIACVHADVGRLPFADNSFDRVVAVDAFHHFVSPNAQTAQPAAARQMLRVIRPGGRVIIEEPDVRRFGVKLIALAEKLLLMHSRMLTPAALTGLFAAERGQCVLEYGDHFNVWLCFRTLDDKTGEGDPTAAPATPDR